MKGTVYIIAAASGTGKTSLVKALVDSIDNLIPSISYTTRSKRSSEKEGESYFFTSEEKFKAMVQNGEFLEHAKVFDYYYGTSKKFVDDKLNEGYDVILEIDWQGARQIKSVMPQSVSIFVLPPSIEELAHRLKNRNQDSKKIIKKRLAKAKKEISHYHEFDYVLVNDEFDDAFRKLNAIISRK